MAAAAAATNSLRGNGEERREEPVIHLQGVRAEDLSPILRLLEES